MKIATPVVVLCGVEKDTAKAEFIARLASNAWSGADESGCIELWQEAWPVLSELAQAAPQGHGDPGKAPVACHDAWALVRRLGYRASVLSVSPHMFAGLGDACGAALAALGSPLSMASARSLSALLTDGFTAAFRDTCTSEVSQARAAAWPCTVVAPNLVLWAVAGPADSESLSQATDELGRLLFECEVKGLVADVSAAAFCDNDAVRAALAADELVRVLGGRCIFVGLRPADLALAKAAGCDVSLIETAPTCHAALKVAFPWVGVALRPAGRVSGLLRGGK